LPYPDARTAHRLEDARPGRHQVSIDVGARDGVEDLTGAGRDGQLHLGMDDAPAEDRGHPGEILIRRVDGGPHTHLCDGGSFDFANGDDVAGRVGLCDERLQPGQVDDLDLVVRSTGIRRERFEIILATLHGQPLARALVAREDGRRRSRLQRHVADRAPLHHREGLYALPDEFEALPVSAPDAVAPEQLQHDVFGFHPVRQSAVQLEGDHGGTWDPHSVSGQRRRDVEASCTQREHPRGPRHDGV